MQQYAAASGPSSLLSRSASYAGSSLFNEPFPPHERDLTDDHSVSSNSSRPGSFRNSYWMSRNLADTASVSSDSLSRTPDQVLTKEGQMQMSASTVPEAGYIKDSSSTTANSRRSLFHRNLSGTHSSLFKLEPKFPFRRQKSECRSSFQASVSSGGHLSLQDSGSPGGAMDWSREAFSQLVASSQRDSFQMLDNMSDSMEILGGTPSSVERIRGVSRPNTNQSSPPEVPQGDAQTCGICSRWLIQRSPWSSQIMLVSNGDLPVVGVLACGHVFHADCLEKGLPDALRHDPPCPTCDDHHKEAAQKAADLVKRKLTKFGPPLRRKRSFSIAKSSSSAGVDRQKGISDEGGFFQRSFSRKQIPFLSKSRKDGSSQILNSRKAQVSPENQEA